MCGINGFNFRDEDLIKKMMAFTKNQVFLKSYKL